MGTRSLTVVKSEWNDQEIMVMYRQFDGYLEGHGKELAKYLLGKKVINGIGSGDNWNNAFNGMSCLAASVVAHFKNDIGDIYLYPSATRGCGEEYIYTITKYGSSRIHIQVEGYGEEVFEGTPAELLKHIANDVLE